eukprot:m.375528 g.375528  ORF g.375528 m.375528 type:complete len:349 (-) comp56179_c0_seq2:2220-3266(-)
MILNQEQKSIYHRMPQRTMAPLTPYHSSVSVIHNIIVTKGTGNEQLHGGGCRLQHSHSDRMLHFGDVHIVHDQQLVANVQATILLGGSARNQVRHINANISSIEGVVDAASDAEAKPGWAFVECDFLKYLLDGRRVHDTHNRHDNLGGIRLKSGNRNVVRNTKQTDSIHLDQLVAKLQTAICLSNAAIDDLGHVNRIIAIFDGIIGASSDADSKGLICRLLHNDLHRNLLVLVVVHVAGDNQVHALGIGLQCLHGLSMCDIRDLNTIDLDNAISNTQIPIEMRSCTRDDVGHIDSRVVVLGGLVASSCNAEAQSTRTAFLKEEFDRFLMGFHWAGNDHAHSSRVQLKC